MMTLLEFIEETKTPIDIDLWRLFGELPDDQLLYITDEIIQNIGYSGALEKQRSSLKDKLLKGDFVKTVDYHLLTQRQYFKYYTESRKLHRWPAPTNVISNNTVHILIKPDVFKSACLDANPRKSNRIRKYFLQIERLHYAYFKYQCQMYEISYELALRRLTTMEHIVTYTQQTALDIIDSKIADRMRVGVVYFIRPLGLSIVKIGYTYNLPQRLAELQCGCWQTLLVIHSYHCMYPSVEEAILHRMYSKYRVRGEWFQLTRHYI